MHPLAYVYIAVLIIVLVVWWVTKTPDRRDNTYGDDQ